MNRRAVPSDVLDLVTAGVLDRAVALAVANAAAGSCHSPRGGDAR
jgi:hypothetical protein